MLTPRIRLLIDALHGLSEPSEAAVRAVFAAHESSSLGRPSQAPPSAA